MLSIEPANNRDFEAIFELDHEAWKNNTNGEFIPDGQHAWRLWCEHAITYVAREDDKIIGAALAFLCENGTYCVHKLIVAQDARGKGIAGILFPALLEKIDSKKADAFLTVDPKNEVAIKIYERLGFTERKFVKGYYRENEDRFVLTRKSRG